jgi:hypothetical protein
MEQSVMEWWSGDLAGRRGLAGDFASSGHKKTLLAQLTAINRN